MTGAHTRATEVPSVQIPLIEYDDTQLDRSLLRLEIFLQLFGFCQFSPVTTILSCLAFALLGVILLALTIVYCYCEKYQIRVFELQILCSQAIVAAISLLCISHNIRKYGVRKLLFVDRYHGHMIQFPKQYIHKIHGFYWKLSAWVVLCFLLKTAQEVTRVVYLHDDSWWKALAVLAASLVYWTYLTTLFLSGTALFNLEDKPQVPLVTANQFMALLRTTEKKEIINLINAGDFAILSIVQLVGIFLCLNAAAKISHRAQSLGSVASRWHALVTCNSNESSQSAILANGVNTEAAANPADLSINYSESDLESADSVLVSTNTQITSNMSSYHKRQAFVTYVSSNTGGFTIFGWMVYRHLINTIFFIELSLVFFALGKTITITTR